MNRSVCSLLLLLTFSSVPGAQDPKPAGTDATNKGTPDVARQRMEVMASRIKSLVISSPEDGFPKRMEPVPLFRYDDETRGYVDGTVWRLGEKGRPLAIITAELHPRYLNGGPRVVYDFLSMTGRPFTARSPDVPGWTPGASAMDVQPLPDAPEPDSEPGRRLTQLKRQARRFSGSQDVQELDRTSVELRLLPKEIGRYSPGADPRADGALFLLVNGRNPSIVLFIETNGKAWTYGVGRLSSPSTLKLRLDGDVVWTQPPFTNHQWNQPYTASNVPGVFP